MQKPGFSVSLFILLLFCIGNTHAQQHRTEVCVDFRVNSTTIDPAFSDNAARMKEIIHFLQQVRRDSLTRVVEVSFCGSASPDGNYQTNRRLARERLSALERLVRREVEIPESLVTRNDNYIPWDTLCARIERSQLPYKDSVLAILKEDARPVGEHSIKAHTDNRIVRLKQLDGGKVWRQLNSRFFSTMRNASAVIVTLTKEKPPVAEPAPIPEVEPETPEPAATVEQPEPMVEPEPVVASVEEPLPAVEEVWQRHLHLKTNALGWALAIANLSAEVDLTEHWSFALPIYYSAWNYFTSTIKFRTFAIQPELRYWLSEHNDGFFAGAHFGLAYYNLAIDGDYRYQDHSRRSPALGGGVSVGYRIPISRNNRWRMEFSLGAGVYSLHYDKFYNTPHTSAGLLAENIKKTYWGIDEASVSFTYMFDLNKKGGRK